MRIKNLGQTGLKVSEICLGTMTFGGQADEQTSHAIIDRALDAGVNFVDTADVYPAPGSPETAGRTEEVIGRWLPGKRDRVVLATKCRSRVGPGPNDEGLSRKHIMAAIDTSLRRLQTDYVDLYQVHWPDGETPLEETLRALDDLVRSGKVRYIGCSNFEAWRLCKALWTSDRLNLARFDSVQPHYNLIYRPVERELLPLCLDQGIGVIAYSPLGGGLLTGKYRRGQPPPEGARFGLWGRERLNDRILARAERVTEIAGRVGATPAQVSLAWLLQQPALTSAIVGATRPDHLDESLAAVDLELDAATTEELSRIAPP